MADSEAQFVRLVNESQRGLYAYILQLVPNRVDANDILGETNLVLWQKRQEFELGTSFGAWASRIAYFEVRAFRTRLGRERLLFDNDLVSQLAEEGEAEVELVDDARRQLIFCLEKLPRKDRSLLESRYQEGKPPREIARTVKRSARAVAQALFRIRTNLLHCMQEQAAQREKSA